MILFSVKYFKNIYKLLFISLIIFELLFFTKQICYAGSSVLHPKLAIDYHHTQSTQKKQSLFNKAQHNLSSAEKNKQQKIFTAENSGSSTWSNAFNFNKSSGAEVDPRTGTLLAYFKVGSLLSNLGHGPDINLQINYNSNTLANPDGLGLGWSWNLTHFNPVTQQLATSTGQVFYLIQQSKYHWKPCYHKLNDIRIDGDKSTHFVITYANGLRETLSHEGYITRLEQQDGRSVYFIYQKGSHLLKAIADDQKNEIMLYRSQGYLNVVSYGSAGQPVTVRINQHSKKLNELILPLNDLQKELKIHISYIGNVITQVEYPNGLKKTYEYDCSQAMKMPVQWFLPKRARCVVSKEMVIPGAEQPLIQTHYHYSRVNINEHNYLGYNSGVTLIQGVQKDILFEAPVKYIYHTETDNGIVREMRTYDKYHLMTDDKLISDNTGRTLSETQSFFCSTKLSDGCSQTSFKDLPLTYSLPLKVVTKVWGTSSSNTPAINTITKEYDDQGRLMRNTDAYGRMTLIRYCPVTGDAACPPPPQGWRLSTLPESETAYPAVTVATESTSPPITTYNYYRKEQNRHGTGYILVLDYQAYHAGKQQIKIIRHYYTDATNALTYGLLKQTILTGTTSSLHSSLTSLVYDYSYEKSLDNHRKTTYKAIEMSYGKLHALPTITTSLFTNQMLESIDAAGKNITRYHYDLLGNMTQTDSAVGTPFAATRRYQYIMFADHNQAIVTAANGLQQKVTFDNAGRQLVQFNEVVSASGTAERGHWSPKKAFYYDAYGRIAMQRTYTTDENDKTITLTATKTYDDMGRVSQIHLPDGETVFTLYDNTNRCMVNYRQSRQGIRSAVSIVRGNVLDKPTEKRTLPSTEGPLPTVKELCATHSTAMQIKTSSVTYDGFGHSLATKDPMGRIVRKYYDAFGHLSDITDPLGDTVHLVHNLTGQVIQRWALPARGGHYLLSSASYNTVGQLLWKSGEDGKKTLFTYTKNGQTATTTTPEGHLFSWQYNVLGLPVSQYMDRKVLLQYAYDPISTKIIKKTDITGMTTWKYSVDGFPQQQIHSGNNGYPDYQLYWHYDRNRRIVSASDITGNLSLIQYDTLGRIAALRYQHQNGTVETVSSPLYDDFSRTREIDYGSGMQRKINYDVWGHQNKVTDTQTGKLFFQWKFAYDAGDNITALYQQAENNKQATLNYLYDALDNLVTMTCKGLSLCPRDTAFTGSGLNSAPVITRQNYTFTDLNRMEQVKEKLQSSDGKQTLNKVMTYGYGDIKAPLRLQQISITWNEKTPVTHRFAYDLAGNMRVDGEGNQMTYDPFNQITHVVKTNGEQSHYTYDGSGKEVLEKSITGNSYLFYRAGHLINEKISNFKGEVHTVGYQGVIRTVDGLIREYKESNYKGDVTAILTKNNNNQYTLSCLNLYSPYGMVWHSNQTPQSLEQQNFLGFDGERTDPATGWQFLGAGHRTYNPEQRYFVSEDPAGGGYAFGSNNPVMHTDPSGNLPKWLNTTFKIMQYCGTCGLSYTHNRWVTLTGSIFMGLITVSALGAAVYIKNVSFAIGLATIGSAAMTSLVSAAANAFPANKGLNITAAVLGTAQAAAFISSIVFMSGFSVLKGLSSLGNAAGASSIAVNAPSEVMEMSSIASANVVNESPIQMNALETEASLSTRLRETVPNLIADDVGGNYLNLDCYANVEEAWDAITWHNYQPDNNVSTVLLAGVVSKKYVNIGMLETLLTTSEDSEAYSSALRGLLYNLSEHESLPEDGVVSWKDVFPNQNRMVVLVKNNHTKMMQWLENVGGSQNFHIMEALSINDGGFESQVDTYQTIIAPFINPDGRVTFTEFYRL